MNNFHLKGAIQVQGNVNEVCGGKRDQLHYPRLHGLAAKAIPPAASFSAKDPSPPALQSSSSSSCSPGKSPKMVLPHRLVKNPYLMMSITR